MRVFVTSIITCALALPLSAHSNALFKSGELVVKGKAADIQFSVVHYYPNADLTVLSVGNGNELSATRNIRAKGKFAHVNLQVTAFAIVDDPFATYQWNWQNIQAHNAWDITTGGNTIVAVLDTGLATNPVDGINCVIAPYDVYNPTGYPEDGDGHGTHVAGTVAQATNNNTGVAGLAHSACIMPVKVLDDNGSGSMAAIADGIYYAVNNGAHVINMSLGVSARYNITSDPILDPALDYAFNNGVTVVAASGNDASKRNISYPASYKTVISVGATDLVNQVTRYSNRGALLDIVAPGGDTSADQNGDGYGDGILQETRVNGSWGYYFFQGTSMASPHVAALSAMLISNGTATTPDEIKTALTQTAVDLYDSGWDKISGAGLINAHAALQWQPGVTPPPVQCTDNDNDGVCIEDGDCDDSNANIHPNMNDSKGRWSRDGVDNNCNGIIDG
ncbi:S8 family serine peptidase (plasmid) [Pseudoalteromonas sp. T1lg65]|uniref:S8 family serine peptidase n=1 Tax=Pseudoalteromonas sp. T1lg65 TaxID=2077101 RepID=UPI003F7B323F